jgi:hypothetical protein
VPWKVTYEPGRGKRSKGSVIATHSDEDLPPHLFEAVGKVRAGDEDALRAFAQEARAKLAERQAEQEAARAVEERLEELLNE